MKRGEKKECENIIRLVSGASFSSGELRRHVDVADDCKQILHNSRDEELASESSRREVGKNGSGSSVSAAVLYGKDAEAVLRRQTAVSSSHDAFFSSQDVSEETRHSVGTLHGRKTKRKMRERFMASRSSKVW